MGYSGENRRTGDMEMLQRIAALEVNVETMKKDISNISLDIRELRDLAARGKGSLGMLLRIGAATCTVVGLLAAVAGYITGGAHK